MSEDIIIEPVNPTKSSLKRFVKFGIDLYRNSPYFVPPLISDEVETLMPDKNPAFDYCQAQAFMAWRGKKPVGRIVAIINNVVNERTGKKEARFSFVDFIDDDAVVDALFAAAEQWARDRGMTEMVGPMGFTDMDHEGMLVEGFDQMGTMATIYNYDYYPRHLQRLGYKKDADWARRWRRGGRGSARRTSLSVSATLISVILPWPLSSFRLRSRRSLRFSNMVGYPVGCVNYLL